MNGIEATKLIFKYYKGKKMSPPIIIACTAYSGLKIKVNCFDVGMKYFLQKPIDKNTIHQILVKHGFFED